MKDLHHEIDCVMLLEPANQAGVDGASAWLDMKGFEAAEFLVTVGALTGVDADSFLTLKLQESDLTTDISAGIVPAADMIGEIAGTVVGAFALIDLNTEDQKTFKVGYIGDARYVRVLCDYTAGTGGITVGIVDVVALVAHPRHGPVTAPAAVAAT